MLKYIIIQLCDSSVSFCHYIRTENQRLIPLKDLEQGILWSIKQGVSIQVLYPKYQLPDDYVQLLTVHPHIKIAAEELEDSDVVILNGWDSIKGLSTIIKQPTVIQCTYKEFINNHLMLSENLYRFARLNIVFTDICDFSDSDIPEYKKALTVLSDTILESYRNRFEVQLNLITDRIMLTEMNNCNAGSECITLAPDGKFYPCPAFYLNQLKNIGNPIAGLKIPNSQLYELENAPICRICDAFHCKRCVMLNKTLTLEINTPSHQQCVMAHIEREVSKRLLEKIRKYGDFVQNVEIPKIDYIDPFEKIIK